MAFAKQIQLMGDQTKYELSPELKRYTLIDLGFNKKNNGDMELRQPLTVLGESKVVKAQLKLVVNAKLDGFKMETLDGKGLRKINLFKGTMYQAEKKQLEFVLQNLITRKVLQIAK